MLSIDGLHAAYGKVSALESVSLKVEPGQIVCLLGANGAGKTTTLNCVSGWWPRPRAVSCSRARTSATCASSIVASRGVVQVPEGRAIFTAMSVEDNLTLGAWRLKNWRHGNKQRNRDELERVYTLFPRLRERATQFAGTLSGGEQQMLMIGRALMAKPKLLMLDEPSLGLSPILVQQVFDIIKTIHRSGIAILLVEQNARVALDVSSYGYILENGEINLQGNGGRAREEVHRCMKPIWGGGSVIRH